MLNCISLRKTFIQQVIRFSIVGVIATVIHYVIYWLLQDTMNKTIAYSAGYAISFICNFFLSSIFTFKEKATIKKGFGFICSHLFNYLLQVCLLNLFLHIGIDSIFAPAPVYCICIPVNFLMVRFVFCKLK